MQRGENRIKYEGEGRTYKKALQVLNEGDNTDQIETNCEMQYCFEDTFPL